MAIDKWPFPTIFVLDMTNRLASLTLIFLLAALLLAFTPLSADDNLQDRPDNSSVHDTTTQHEHEHSAEALSQQASENDNQATRRNQEKSAPGLSDFLLTGKHLWFLVLAAAGLLFLIFRGVNPWFRTGLLAGAFILFGLDYFYPLHPSPMCAVTKLFMFKFTLGEFFPAFLVDTGN